MTNREVDGVSVVALDGRIVLGEESNALREKVKSLVAAGKKKIILSSKFQEVLQITKLLTVFDVFNTEAEAVASFSKGAGA